jgi:hypothetical protein
MAKSPLNGQSRKLPLPVPFSSSLQSWQDGEHQLQDGEHQLQDMRMAVPDSCHSLEKESCRIGADFLV